LAVQIFLREPVSWFEWRKAGEYANRRSGNYLD